MKDIFVWEELNGGKNAPPFHSKLNLGGFAVNRTFNLHYFFTNPSSRFRVLLTSQTFTVTDNLDFITN